MSRIIVDSLRGNSASSDAISLANDGTATANLTTVNSVTMPNGGFLSNRNLIINGAMQVAQRGTSSTSSGYYTVDRFTTDFGGTDEAPTFAQADVASGTTPYTSGFRKSLKVTNGNQTSGAGTADFIGIGHRIEAQNLATSGWNYVSASSYITLSFWVKSSVAQSFKGYVKTSDGSAYIYSFDTGSLSADTWTKVTKTISGNSNLTINNDTGLGLEFYIWQFAGTDYTASSVTEDAWASYASGTRMKDETSTWYTTNDATFEITGLQLEVGSVATDFEHRSFGDELARCQRYYFNIEGDNDDMAGCPAYAVWHDVQWFQVTFPVPMRANPSYTGSATAGRFYGHNSSNNFNFNQLTLNINATDTIYKYCRLINNAVSGTAEDGMAGELNFQADNGKLEFSAEL